MSIYKIASQQIQKEAGLLDLGIKAVKFLAPKIESLGAKTVNMANKIKQVPTVKKGIGKASLGLASLNSTLQRHGYKPNYKNLAIGTGVGIAGLYGATKAGHMIFGNTNSNM